ncbi:MAG: rhombosortase [bacterium]|nr:rhombosortase [bacterium]
MRDRLPRSVLVSLAAVVVAVVVHVVPDVSSAWIFERDAIKSWQLWRILTSSWVHYSWAHLAHNALVIIACGVLLRDADWRRYAALLLGGGLVVGLGVFLLRPDVARFAGLSGVACGATALAALRGMRHSGQVSRLHLALLAGLVVKLGFELATDTSLLDLGRATVANPLLPFSHVLGAASALLVACDTGSAPSVTRTRSTAAAAAPGSRPHSAPTSSSLAW